MLKTKEKRGGKPLRRQRSVPGEVSRWCDGQASPRPHWIETPPRGLNQLTNLWRKLLLAAVARDATGLSVTGSRSNAADLTGLGGWVHAQNSGRSGPRTRRCGVMPLMAGSPGLSRKRLYWGGGASCSIPEVTSGACAVGARTNGGLANPKGEEDEGRGQRAVANGRANDTKSSTMRKCGSGSSLKGTVGHDERARGGAHVHKSPSGFRRSASGERWRDGNTVRPPRGLPG
jgi:hypothetical protein